MKKTFVISASAVAIMAALSVTPTAHAENADTAQLMVVQALPGQIVDVTIDRRPVGVDVTTGSLLGPFDITAGEHYVSVLDEAGSVVLETAVDLTAGSRQDLVVHLPAELLGDPVATLYETPTEPIGVDKARVLIAHTASVAPADVSVDGTVVFRNIANGEFATADVAAGDHVAELLPAGVTGRPILGPLNVSLPASTATMVYAVGDLESDSMKVISHSVSLSSNGAEAPALIDAGSAGLAAGITVSPFSAPGVGVGVAGSAGTPLTTNAAALGALGALFALAYAAVALRGRRWHEVDVSQ